MAKEIKLLLSMICLSCASLMFGFYISIKVNPPISLQARRYLVVGADAMINASETTEAIEFHCQERQQLYQRYADITWGKNQKCENIPYPATE